jgi:phosphoglycolate phosphatase
LSPARAPVRAVVFDLDGTLVDSRPDLATAVNELRREHDLPAADLGTVGSWIGEGARRLVERAIAGVDLDLDAALARFLGLYESVCTVATQPYPGVDEMLDRLAGRRRLALLTNKPERMTRAIVDHFGWSGRFDPLVAGDTLPFRKPDPRGLLAIAAELGVDAGALVLVGDSRIDERTAFAAGSRFLWVDWGYAAPAERVELARGPSASSAGSVVDWISRP